MPEGARKRGDRTRHKILLTALNLFQSNGYHGTSMRQIAKQAGVALGGIYNHFSSKDALFLAVLEAYHPYHEVVRALQTEEGLSFEEFVRVAAGRMLDALEQRPYFISLMLIEIVEFKSKHIPQLFTAFYPQIYRLIEDFSRQQGDLRQVPIPIVVRAFIGLFFSYYITGAMLGNQFPVEFGENALEYFVEIFLRGVMVDR